jgi:hypothetical protein
MEHRREPIDKAVLVPDYLRTRALLLRMNVGFAPKAAVHNFTSTRINRHGLD